MFFIKGLHILDQPHKYDLRKLGILKEVFGFKSLDEFLPDGIPKNEQIIIRYKKEPKKKSDGSDSKLMDNVLVEIIVVKVKQKQR